MIPAVKLATLAGAVVLAGCATTLQHDYTNPVTGRPESKTYKIAYGNTLNDSAAGVTFGPDPAAIAAGERVVTYGMTYGGQALWRELSLVAVDKALDK